MINRHTTFFKALNLITDYLLLNVSLAATYLFENKINIFTDVNKKHLPVILIFNLTWLLSANISGLYRHVLNKDSIVTFRNVFRTYFLFVSFICFAILILIGPEAYFITRRFLFFSILIYGVLLGAWKVIFLLIRKSERAALMDIRDAVIVGAGRSGKDLHEYLIKNWDTGFRIVGFFDDDPGRVTGTEIYLGDTASCISYAKEHKITEIFCTLPIAEEATIKKLMTEADKNLIRVKSVPEYYDYGNKPVFIQSFGQIPIISIRKEPLENLLNRLIKRCFDIVFSLFIIVFVLSWLFPILAILIKLESKGPVFFVQTRSGHNNNPFPCFKFRSMYVNGGADKVQATRNDRRITRLGAFMRRTSIDELPQFINVLTGDMSVVGPRPHMVNHTEEYSDLIDLFMVRHFLKPGITGWAQIKGLRGETKTVEAMNERVEADLWYLENWSFLLDLKIIFLTLRNLLVGDDNAF
ncbi:MAG TPA: undecaprenyl-phosphate glucose phosphotransferase [Mucilaginibacter sp.]|nr:undecaprenyl-phosphate glucose phosphotransferase [Mucilaginibacter sp.]